MSDRKFVIFIDSLGTDDLEHMPWVRENITTGEMDTRPVYVTPTVLSQVYTGKTPPENGLPAVSRYDEPSRSRPDGLTIPEYAAAGDKYETVIQMGLPFIHPPDVNAQGTYWHSSASMGQGGTFPPEAPISIPAPPGEIDKPDENMDLAFDARIDHLDESFARMRNATIEADADLTFFGYRVTDSYCHYQNDQPEDGPTYRERLLKGVDTQIKATANLGEVFIFGDHGSTELESVFRINRWLMEHGYLDVGINEEWRERARDFGFLEPNESVPGETINQNSPGVMIDEESSVAIGADPFSTGITLLDGANQENVSSLIDDLEAVDGISRVVWTEDEWGDGEHLDSCPDLYAERETGVFVSGNMAPEKGGAELTRSGVHHPFAVYGSTEGIGEPESTPRELFSEIANWFLGLDTSDTSNEGTTSAEMDERNVEQHLEDMGYL